MLKRSMLKQGYTIAFFLLATGGLCLAQSESPSLADLARKSRSGKKPAPTLATVNLTDDNFVRRTPVEPKNNASASPADAKAPAGEKQSDAADGSAKPASGNEKSTKADASKKAEDLKKEELKKQLDSFKASRDAWSQSANRYENLLANEPDEFRRQMYQDALNNDRQNVSVYQKKIDEAEGKSGTGSGENPDQQASGSGNKP
jgi:phage terminase Nu1 subunit (DNA packaging protein)